MAETDAGPAPQSGAGAGNGAAAVAPKIDGEQDLEFVLAHEVVYHRARESFLSGAHRWTMFGVIVFGASAAATLAPQASGLIAVMLGAADIAFDFTGRAQAHADVARRYLTLVARFAEGAEAGDIRKHWLEISADEPPAYRLAALVAHNEVCDALGRGEKVPLTFWQRARAQIWRS